jgi:hypothetical protein
MKVRKTLKWFGGVLMTGALAIPAVQADTLITTLTAREPGGQSVVVHAQAYPVTVIVFISISCPMSCDYSERLSTLYRQYHDRIQMVVIDSNVNESDADVEKYRTDASLPFSIYRDPGFRTADLLKARTTPTAVVLDRTGSVRYFGSIDDSRHPARVKRENLRLAIDAILEGRTVERPAMISPGCAIQRLQIQ